MDKLYGYKEKDVLGLAEFIRARKNKTLSKVFSEYAEQSGKAKGTVRNMYYALCKACEKDEVLKAKYFESTPLLVNKIVGFKDCEVRALIKAVLSAKAEGKSARSVVMELAGGDVKTALRFQNKYRSALRNRQDLVNQIASELNIENEITIKPKKSAVSDAQMNRLKKEIDGLVERLSRSLVSENQRLKEKISALEYENLRLSRQLFGAPKAIDALSQMRRNGNGLTN